MMSITYRSLTSFIATLMACCFLFAPANAQNSQLQQAMNIRPNQSIEYERPGIAVLKECKTERIQDPVGFVVFHSSGRILRQFVDVNKDGKLDQWAFYNNGQEVYRDIDSNYDGRVDQFRWLGEAGSRWGLDPNQDGNIDSWKVISAEEVAYECFQSIKNRDQDRFNRLLITPKEFSELKLPTNIAKDIQTRWNKARTKFVEFARTQKKITSKSRWVYAGNGWPSMMASDGRSKDLVVYNHGAGFFDDGTGNQTEQLAIGSLVKIGEVWRMIELPELYTGEALATGGAFFPMRDFGLPEAPTAGDKEMASLYDKLAEIEQSLPKAKGAQAEKLEKEKAELYRKFITLTRDKNTKTQWVETLADSVSSAYQADRFENAIEYLNSYISTEKSKGTPALDYVAWRAIFAEYGWINQNGDRQQRDKAHKKLVQQLKDFVRVYPSSQFAPDALIQLGVSYEVSDPDDESKALEWYRLCAKNYGGTSYGKRAAGAVVRLNSIGKKIAFRGQTVQGRPFDLSRYSGRIVVLHFWQTWCDDGIDELAKLKEKYKDDVIVVSCNIEAVVGAEGLDTKASTAKFSSYLKKNASVMTWAQLHAPGGVEQSPLAHQLGVSTEPMLAIIDAKGRLVSTNVAFGALEREVELERRRKD